MPIYMMINAEMDGPDALRHSMRELCAVLFTEEGAIVGEFTVALEPLEERESDAGTMQEFWAQHAESWTLICSDAVSAEAGMARFSEFYAKAVQSWGEVCFVADPASRDFTWLLTYLTLTRTPAPFSSQFCHCLATMRHCYQHIMRLSEEEALKERRRMQRHMPITHRARDSAQAQVYEFAALRAALARCTQASGDASTLARIEQALAKQEQALTKQEQALAKVAAQMAQVEWMQWFNKTIRS